MDSDRVKVEKEDQYEKNFGFKTKTECPWKALKETFMEIDIYGEYIDLLATKYVLNYLYIQQQYPKNCNICKYFFRLHSTGIDLLNYKKQET